MNRLLIEDGKRTLFSPEHPEGQAFAGEVGDDWLVQIRSQKLLVGSPNAVDCSGRVYNALRVALASEVEAHMERLYNWFNQHTNGFDLSPGDLPPGQMRSRLLGIPGTTEAERAARAAKMAEVFATGAVHIPSRLHEADLEPLDYLEGFPDYERVLEARNLTADDMIREFTEFEDHSEADLVPRSDRLQAFREGFEALERPETAQKPPKTDPNSLLLALFRWGEARAEEEIRLSPKLFALVTEAVFPSGETVLERFLASARVVKPYFRAEVSENGLKLTDLEGI